MNVLEIIRSRKTKIICTLGPASSDEDTIKKMMLAGMNVARLNFSHGSYEVHQKTILLLRRCATELGIPFAILQDLQGPKIRIGKLENHEKVFLKPGDLITITTEPSFVGNKQRVNTSYTHLVEDCRDGGFIMLDDGLLRFQIIERKFAKDSDSLKYDEMVCEVIVGGYLGENKGINVPHQIISAPCLTKKDIADLEFGMENGVDYVCMSFVREAQDIVQGKDLMRKFIRENEKIRDIVDEKRLIPIIAKIERAEAIKNIEEILENADGVMVARGDLAVEMDYDELPILQKRLIAISSKIGKIDITATQMLQSMVDNVLPTRAESTDVANAIFDGTDVIMMSNETATGLHPIKAVEVMAKIAETADKNYNEFCRLGEHTEDETAINNISEATALAAASVAKKYKKIKAIVCLTWSGSTAVQISQFKPDQPIIALTASTKTYNRLSLAWGVIPVKIGKDQPKSDFEDIEAQAVKYAKEMNIVKPNDAIALVIGAQTHSKVSKSLRIVNVRE